MKIDASRNIAAGANSSHCTVYVDRHIPAKFRKFLAVHEETEAEHMGKGYAQAHRIATAAERAAVERAGLDWKKYTEEIDGYLDRTEHEPDQTPRGAHVSSKVATGKAGGGHYRRRADRR